MTRYEWEYVRPDEEGGFDVFGEIVFVDAGANPTSRGCHVLVERPDEEPGESTPFEFTSDTERDEVLEAEADMARDVAENPELYGALSGEPPTCSGSKADGSPCTREVDESGDFCWQHEGDN